jgi:type I restriction enzyme R subunit
MLGRATRLCPEIGKETFRIFDAVDLYDRLQDLTDMKPVAADPNISLAQLLDELVRIDDAEHRAAVRDQIIVRMSRRLKRLATEARARFELEAGEPPEATLQRFRRDDARTMAAWVADRPGIGALLDWTTDGGTPRMIPISEHPDEVISVTRGYGAAQRPEDFLGAFAAFVRNNINQIPALMLAVQRPRDLTREQLRQLRLRLDAEGFSDANIRRAWSDARNEDIAASIIGYVRQAALGDPLVPYAERVSRAVAAIIARGGWTDVQKRWLRRIGEQIEKEIVVDRESLDQEPFRADGGFRVLNQRFGGRLEAVLGDICEAVWKTA